MRNRLLYFISFFTFIGYFFGLTLIYYFGLSDFSRYYSIPLRLLISILMIYIMCKIHFKYKSGNLFNYFLFWSFWVLYFIAIIKAALSLTGIFHISPFEFAAYSILYSILPFLFFSLKHDDHTFKIFRNALITSGVLLAITSFYLYGSLFFAGVGRISMAKYTMGDDFEVISPLALSYSSSLIISICLYYLFFTIPAKKVKSYYWIAIILSIVPFFLGASRGSVFALIFSISAIVYFKGNLGKKIRSIIVLIVLGAVLIYAANFVGSSVLTRILSISEDIDSGSDSAIRLIMWHSAWSQFLNSPIWGDSIQSNIPPHPHNIILEVLMSVGLLGFIPFIMLLIKTLRKSIKILKYRSEHVWIPILFFQGFIQHLFSGVVYAAIFFWAGMALVFSVDIYKKNES